MIAMDSPERRDGIGGERSSSEELADARMAVRQKVWDRMREVARPDSRYVYDFASYNPDYPGSERFPDALRALPFYAGTGPVFVTPDNCLDIFRSEVIREGRPMLQTVAVAMGFHFIGPGDVPPGSERFAGTLDGALIFGKPVDLEFVRALGPLDWVVTGTCAVNPSTGVRFGKGHGFFDLEWGIMASLGIVNEETPLIICAHDYELVDEELPAADFDTAGDWVITPTRTIKIPRTIKKPPGIDWNVLGDHLLREIQPLRELRDRMKPPSENDAGV
jgi:5-formyltetrahydrofolate cyclo-ligase